MTQPTESPDRVLATLNRDGSRYWIHPRLVRGRLWWRRAVVGYALIALFVALPLIQINGKPGILIDLITREFTFLGTTFRPSDTFLLLLLGIASLLGVFWVTALLGRVWCGWGCPQTVYMEFVFRPIEHWLEGNPAQRRKLDGGRPSPRRLLKWAIYAVLAFVLANVFLSYFVGWERLIRWITHSPAVHPFGFGVVLFVSALVFFDFAYFREQMCTVACPYGRLQSVMVDPNSLIVGYDAKRGEPRGKGTKGKRLPMADETPATGDCIDCGACVAVCPTGIDIRNGLQMECIGCTQCIDACAPIMAKLGRPAGLIRYSSQRELEGQPTKMWRPRTLLYPVAIAAALALFGFRLAGRTGTEVWVVRNAQIAYSELPDRAIATSVRVKIENKSEQPRVYTITLVGGDGVLIAPTAPIRLAPFKATTVPVFVRLERGAFVAGKHHATLRVSDGGNVSRELTVTLFGPQEE